MLAVIFCLNIGQNIAKADTSSTTVTVSNAPSLIVKMATPDAIGDLSIPYYQGDSVTLSWQVANKTADQGALYDIRYNTVPITENNFASSTQVTGAVIPQSSLSFSSDINRSEIVSLKLQNVKYYFALKSSFDGSSWSQMSDVPSFSITSGTESSIKAPTKDLSIGMTDPDVGLLQKFLAMEGFYNGPITSHFGNITKAALINFQKTYNVTPVSGNFGKITRGVVNDLLQS